MQKVNIYIYDNVVDTSIGYELKKFSVIFQKQMLQTEHGNTPLMCRLTWLHTGCKD
jgi:hypothetical protein